MKPKAEVLKDLGRVRRRKIVIQRKETVKDQWGDITETWVDWRTVWAERGSLWGRDYFAAVAVGEEQTVEFTIRYVAFLEELKTDTHRLVFEGGIYDLKQVDYLKDDGTWLKLRAVRHA
jgi:SPP1 family predicted phage head-tail adaptor